MVVQVVSEEVDEVDRVVTSLLVGVAGEEDEGDVAHAVAHSSVRSFLKFKNKLIKIYLGLNGVYRISFLTAKEVLVNCFICFGISIVGMTL